MNIILASTSKRRAELLRMVNINFTAVPPDDDESYDKNRAVSKTVTSLAVKKANSVFINYPNDIIIGSDTLVVINGLILGKPTDKREAAEMLYMLSNRTHEVYTGVHIVSKYASDTFFDKTQVTFNDLSRTDIEDYIATGESMDKAGAYGIQGVGATLVSHINGDYYSVMGLPISKVYYAIKKHYINKV